MAEGLGEFPFDWIVADLRDGNCIPFLGAGASAFPTVINAKPPSARTLALELARESTYPPYQTSRETASTNDATAQERILRAKLDCENLMLVSSWVEHGRGDRPRLRSKLRAHLANEQKPLPHNALHDLLARVAQQRPMAIITTNYDDLMELALLEHSVPFDLFVVAIDKGTTLLRPAGEKELNPVPGNKELLQIDPSEVRLTRTALFKIHGHVDRARTVDDTFVITEEDYVSFLGRMNSNDSVIPADLVNLMQSHTLLFLGYGLRDWNFRVLLGRLNSLRLQPMKSYAIAYDIEAAEGRLWEKRGVEIFKGDLNEFVPLLDAALAQTPPLSI